VARMYGKMALAAMRWTLWVTLGIALALGAGSCKRQAREESRGGDKQFSYKADGVDLRMTVRATEISMAGLVEIVFIITRPSDMDVAIAQSEDWRGELGLYAQVEEPGRIRDGGKRIVCKMAYSLEPQQPGDFVVEGIKIDYWHTHRPLQRQSIMTEPFSVQVYSLLTGTAAQDPNSADILDIEGPWAPQEGNSYGMLVVLGVILVAIILGCLFKRRPRKELPKQAVEMTPRPGEHALAELMNLRDARLCEQGRFDRFFVRLSDIMRQYIGARFSHSAVSQTTEELLTAISLEQRLNQTHGEVLGDFLKKCDEVKFAGIAVPTDLARTSSEDCRCFIKKTMEVQA
jgi:hypothetical protein